MGKGFPSYDLEPSSPNSLISSLSFVFLWMFQVPPASPGSFVLVISFVFSLLFYNLLDFKDLCLHCYIVNNVEINKMMLTPPPHLQVSLMR